MAGPTLDTNLGNARDIRDNALDENNIEENEFAKYIRERQSGVRLSESKRALLAGSTQNPDQAAKDLELAQKKQLPVSAIQVDRNRFQNEVAFEESSSQIEDYPAVQSWLNASPQYGSMIHDSVREVGEIEKFARNIIGSGVAFPMTLGSGAGTLIAVTGRATKRVSPMMGTQVEAAGEAMEMFAGGIADFMEEHVKVADNKFQQTVSGVTQMGAQMALVRARPILSLPVMALMGIHESRKLIESDPKSASAPQSIQDTEAILGGAVDGLTEWASTLMQNKLFGKSAAMQITNKWLARGLTTVAGGLGEGAQEAMAAMTRQYIHTLLTDNESEFNIGEEAYAAIPEAEIGAYVGMVVQMLGLAKEGYRARKVKENFDDLNSASGVERIRARSPEALDDMAQVVTQHLAGETDGEPLTEVYVDGDAFNQTMAELGVTPDQIEMVFPEIAEQIADNDHAGGDVTISLDKWIGKVAGTKIGDALTPHLRSDPNSLSFAEQVKAEELQGSFAEKAAKILEEKETSDEFIKSANEVKKVVKTQLDEIGRFNSTVNKGYAEFVGDFYITQAKAAGMTPSEYYKKYPYKVQGENAGRGKVLNQAHENGFLGSDIGDAQEWNEAVEKGLDMSIEGRTARAKELGFDLEDVRWHGTDAEFRAFDPKAKRVNRAQNYEGVYTTDRESIAANYGENVKSFVVRKGKVADLSEGPIIPDQAMIDKYREVMEDGGWYAEDWLNDVIIPEYTKTGKMKDIEGSDKTAILQAGGYNSVKDGHEFIVFDPKDIRSTDAAFDPDRSESADLLAQSAWHGTRHIFDRFSLDAMGTGEGAQAYGWGMYFAGKRAIAEWYRDKLNPGQWDILFNGKKLGSPSSIRNSFMMLFTGTSTTPDEFIAAQVGFIKSDPLVMGAISDGSATWSEVLHEQVGHALDINGTKDFASEVHAKIDGFDVDSVEVKFKGELYEVNLPEDSELLYWDTSLNDQPAIKKKLVDGLEAYLDELSDGMTDMDDDVQRDAVAFDDLAVVLANLKDGYLTGQDLYHELYEDNKVLSPEDASKLLNRFGIPGLRYRDGASRQGGKPSAGWKIDGKPIKEFRGRDYTDNPQGIEQLEKLVDMLQQEGVQNYQIIDRLESGTHSEEIQEIFNNLDITEPKYDHNYVIWDEDVVTVESVNDEKRQALEVEEGGTFAQHAPMETAGNYRVQHDRYGAMIVWGDVESIRKEIPTSLRGMPVPGGLMFTPNQAHKAFASLNGDENIFGRAGKVHVIKKDAKGKYIGASKSNDTAPKRKAWRGEMMGLLEEGLPGRFWYEESGAAIFRMTGGDMGKAKKFLALLAIYSPQAKVDANSTFALRAWGQYLAGEPIKVSTRDRDGKATDVLYNDIPWNGEKTRNFYNNLLSQVDPSVILEQGATIDMWMMRAGGYDHDQPLTTEYRFMENEINYFTNKLNEKVTDPNDQWEPQQVQAALWVAIKARMENKNVEHATNAISIKRGWAKRKGFKNLAVIHNSKHMLNWIKHAMAYTPTEKDLEVAKFNFEDGVQRHIGQISWEARPSTKIDMLSGIHDASYEVQERFQIAMQAALSDDLGRDILARHLGMLADGSVVTPGVWENQVSASTQAFMPMASTAGSQRYFLKTYYKTDDPSVELDHDSYLKLSKAEQKEYYFLADKESDVSISKQEYDDLRLPGKDGKKGPADTKARARYSGESKMDPNQRKMVELYSDIMGLLLRQDGVGFHKPTYGGTIQTANGVEFQIGRALDSKEALAFSDAMAPLLEANGLSDEVGIITTDQGVRVVKFYGNLSNSKLHEMAEKAAEVALSGFDVDIKYFSSDGGMQGNNWVEEKNGESYQQRISEAGRSDLLGWSESELYPRVQEVFKRFAEEEGWGEVGEIEFQNQGVFNQSVGQDMSPEARMARADYLGFDVSNPVTRTDGFVDVKEYTGRTYFVKNGSDDIYYFTEQFATREDRSKLVGAEIDTYRSGTNGKWAIPKPNTFLIRVKNTATAADLRRLGFAGKQTVSHITDEMIDALKAEGFDSAEGTIDMLNNPEIIVFDPSNIRSIDAEFALDKSDSANLLAQSIAQEDSQELKSWAGTDKPVIDPDEINYTDFSGEGPFVMKGFHATTHDVQEFDSSVKGNVEGQFGAINYFTSSDYDAETNYLADGTDLTSRIESRTERLEQELEDSLGDDFYDLKTIARIDRIEEVTGTRISPIYVREISMAAEELAKSELLGGKAQVMEVFLKTNKPFVIGDGAAFVEVFDYEQIQSEALENVASENNITRDEAESDEYEDQRYEEEFRLQEESSEEIFEAINRVAIRHGVSGQDVWAEVAEAFSDGFTPAQLEDILRSSETLLEATNEEGDLTSSQILQEIIQELGYDSIILKDADKRFSNMEMPSGTAHIHIFDQNNTNIKSVENEGGFDASNPNIFKQDKVRGTFDPSKLTTTLLKDANYTTFLHETGHFFLTVYADQASQENAPPQAAEDMAILLDWFGVDSLDTWNGMSLDEQRPFHEQFASNFEIYLMEGKSPSLKLQQIFDRFAAWLRNAYRSIQEINEIYKRENGVDLPIMTGEVRQVMDRMLASEKQISEAQQAQNMLPMYQDQAMSGMGDDEWEAYNQLRTEADEAANMKLAQDNAQQVKWLSNAKSNIIKKMQAQHRALRNKAREEIEPEVRAEPIYRTIEYLKKGEVTDEEGEVTILEEHKLDADAVKEFYKDTPAEDMPDLSKLRGMTKKDGLAPDVVAELLGYENVDQMIRAITTANPLAQEINDRVDQFMMDNHSELQDQKFIDEAVSKALHSQARSRFLGVELRHLTKSTQPVRVMVAAAKRAAQLILQDKVVDQIRPKKYIAAEARAAQKVFDELKRGNSEAAVQAKRDQLLNNQLAIEAQKVVDEVEKARVKTTKLTGKNAQKKMRGEYLKQMNNLLARFDFRKSQSLRERNEERMPLADWITEASEEMSAVLPGLPPWVLNDEFRKSYKDMTVTEFRDLMDSITQLETLARREENMYQAIRNQTFQQEKAGLLAEIAGIHPEVFDEEGNPVPFEKDRKPYLATKWGSFTDNFDSEMINVENLLDIITAGRGKVIFETVFNRISTAQDNRNEVMQRIGQALSGVTRAYTAAERLTFSGSAMGEQWSTPSGRYLNREQRIMVGIYYGSVDGRQRLLEGNKFSQVDINAIINKLDEKDVNLIKKFWEISDTMIWPELKAVNERTSGIAPPKVEVIGYTTRFGEVSGGYSPLVYDGEMDVRAFENNSEAALQNLFGGSVHSAATARSASHTRLTNVNKSLDLSLAAMAARLNESVHDFTHREAVADTDRMMSNEDVATTFKNLLGPKTFEYILGNIRLVAKRPHQPNGFFSKALLKLRQNTLSSMMGASYNTVSINVLGFFPMVTRVGPVRMIRATHRIFQVNRNPATGEYDDSQQQKLHKWVLSESKYMRNRLTSIDRDLNQRLSMLRAKGGFLPGMETWFIGLQLMDRAVTLPGWIAAYEKGMATEFPNDHDASRDYADRVIRQTQGAGRTWDLARIASDDSSFGQPLGKLMTMFYNFFSAMLGMQRRSGAIANRLIDDGKIVDAAMELTLTFMGAVVIPSTLEGWYRGNCGDEVEFSDFLPGGDKPEYAEWGYCAVKSSTLFTAAFFPLFRDVIPYVYSMYDKDVMSFGGVRLSPVEQSMETMGRGLFVSVPKIITGDAEEKHYRDFVRGIGYAFGLPGAQAWRTIDAAEALMSGESDDWSDLLTGVPYDG